MTQMDVQEQINAIRQATVNATKSKEAALQFLVDAGIIVSEKEVKEPSKKKR